jgi:hypothetical protein
MRERERKKERERDREREREKLFVTSEKALEKAAAVKMAPRHSA